MSIPRVVDIFMTKAETDMVNFFHLFACLFFEATRSEMLSVALCTCEDHFIEAQLLIWDVFQSLKTRLLLNQIVTG